MRIEVRLCEILGRHHRQGRAFALLLKDGATVAEALGRLKLRPVGFHLALCNGRSLMTTSGAINEAHRLVDGDHLVLAAATAATHAFRQPLHAIVQRLSSLLSPLAHTH